MDIEDFYEADPRRRASAEIELGSEWQDAQGVHYELNYIEDTGELYVMQEPPPAESVDPAGGIHIRKDPSYAGKVIARVIAQIDTVDKLHSILEGWQQAMNGDDSIKWVDERLRVAGVATASAEEG